MKVKVIVGSVVYKGKEFFEGNEFECEKPVAESLLKGNVVEEVKKSQDKDETKNATKSQDKDAGKK